jgi:hypothetical protein
MSKLLQILSYSLIGSRNNKLDKTASTGHFISKNSFDYLSYDSSVRAGFLKPGK